VLQLPRFWTHCKELPKQGSGKRDSGKEVGRSLSTDESRPNLRSEVLFINYYKPMNAVVSIDNSNIKSIIDSGACVSIINKHTFKLLKEQSVVQSGEVILTSASQHEIAIKGLVRAKVTIGGITQECQFYYVPSFSKDALLGLDILDQFALNVDLKTRTITPDKGTAVQIEIKYMDKPQFDTARVKKNTIVKPRHMRLVRCTTDNLSQSRQAMIVERDEWSKPGVYIGRTIIKIPDSNVVHVLLINTSNRKVRLWRNRPIADLEPFAECCNTNGEILTLEEEKTSEDFKQKMNLSDSLTEEQKEELWKIFQKRACVFQKPDKLGITPVKHSIPTRDDIPRKIRQYPLSHAEHEAIEEHIKKMEKEGVIEESTSAWNSPVILVKKKDGTLRFCVDFRALNEKTVIEAYPLPRIDNYLDVLGKAKFFSTIDLITGYWQILLDAQDKEKTAFSTRNRHLQFKVMPFGLAGAPATFQRAMDVLLTGISWHFCLVYLDDILIYSETWEEHIKHVDEVLRRLDEANFKVKPEKCQWGQNSVRFLGHIYHRMDYQWIPRR